MVRCKRRTKLRNLSAVVHKPLLWFCFCTKYVFMLPRERVYLARHHKTLIPLPFYGSAEPAFLGLGTRASPLGAVKARSAQLRSLLPFNASRKCDVASLQAMT